MGEAAGRFSINVPMSTPLAHPFRSSLGFHLLAVDGSRVYDVDQDVFNLCADGNLPAELDSHGNAMRRYVDESVPPLTSLRSISLNVAQGCNLSCSYCYADEGKFGAHARLMPSDVARRAVDSFIARIPRGADAVIGYMGGEPFLNAKLIHEITRYAAEQANEQEVRLRFSVTTNATLLRDEDVELLGSYPFSVAVSLDGGRATNDLQRTFASGRSSYDQVVAGLAMLTGARWRPRHLSLRATVTPRSERLSRMLEDMLDLGVDEAGFSPVMVSPNPRDEFSKADFSRFLQQMIECGEAAKAALLEKRAFPFSNFETALQEIHKGTHRPYPCGAAAGYASVSAEGNLFGCHRAIDDERFAIGSVESGPDNGRRGQFLASRHVLRQEPCSSCWARFLCGGGCHYEVLSRGRAACDYIRGWLEFCLGAYVEISAFAPSYFSDPKTYFNNNPKDA